MNISTDIRPDSSVVATQRRSSPAPDHTDSGTQEQSRPRSIYDITDTVEISDKARAILNGTVDPFAMPYTAEDLAPLKARFSKFHEIENSIHTRLASLLTKQGFTTGMLDQVKVEIDSNGRAIVGGIDDVKAARALEKAINSDKSLLKDIVAYQKEERRLSLDLRKTTGMSLNDYASHIGTLDKMGEKIFLEEENVDPEFAAMLAEQYTDDTAAVNITGQHNILENAEDTVNGMMRAVTGKVEEAFREMNADIQQSGGDPQEIEDSLVNLKRLKISVDNTGGVTIEGTASKENPGTDRAAKKIITEMFEKELQTNPDFEMAAGYLLNTYDETFGTNNPLGLGEDDRTLQTVYDHGMIESHVSSPEREAELTEEIDTSAKNALKDMGVDAKDLVIEMNDEGKLVAANLDPNAPEATKLQNALDLLNKQVENRSIEDAREEAFALTTDPVKRLKGLMANMDVLRPGGASLLQRAESTEA